MFSLPFLLARLYPGRSPEEIEKLVLPCEQAPVYLVDTWSEIGKNDLEKPEIQLGLARTLFQTQFTYLGVVDEIMGKLEEWSEGTILFADLGETSRQFYQRLYGFLGWINFSHISYQRKLFLLDARFLLLATVWEIPLYDAVQKHFAYLGYVREMAGDADLLAGAIARNQTPLGAVAGQNKTVADWIKMFDSFPPNLIKERVDMFLGESSAVRYLPAEEKSVLSKILTLYWGLRGDFIWRELDYSLAAGFGAKAVKENLSVNDTYLQLLYQATQEQFVVWLDSYEEAAEWLWAIKADQNFIRKLLFVLLEKVDLKNH